ncbi:MAG: hypothetical protein HY879_26170 [Deltaproteobacteria bacterium]|nr:hypothetical protein [Deltaproteobacteria bacterium]
MHLNLSSFLQWKINIHLYRKLGWRLALVYIMILGRFYFLFKRKEKKKIEGAIKTVFGSQKGPHEIKMIVKGVLRGILWHYFEKIYNVYTPVERLKNFFDHHIQPEGIGAIEQGIARGKGVLMVTSHFGGIEYIPKYLATRNFPVTILAKFSSEHLRNISLEQAGQLAINLIDPTICPNIIKMMLDNLRKNRIVITQCDEIEEWRPSLHEEVFFLGKRIHLDKTINTLLKRGDTTLVFALMHRVDHHGYQFVAHSRDEILGAFEPSANRTVGELVLRYLEQYIYHHPEEWYQWKKVPEIKTARGTAVPAGDIKSPAWMRPALEGIPQ